MKIARVANTYSRPLVTNASIIRIEMYEDTPKELSILLQAYLSIYYVQRYLLPKEVYSSKRTFSRYLVSTKRLAELPTPRFTDDMVAENSFSEIYLKHLEINNKAILMNSEMRNLRVCLAREEEDTIALFLQNKEQLPYLLEKESAILNEIDHLMQHIEEFRVKAGCKKIKY